MAEAITFTPAADSTVDPGTAISGVWSGYSGFPNTLHVYATTAYGEQLVFSWTLAGDVATFSDGFVGTCASGGGVVSFTLSRYGGWNAQDSVLRLRAVGVDTAPSTATFLAEFPVSVLLDPPVTNHVEQGLDNLLEQFKDKANLVALLTVVLDQVQAFEDAVHPIIGARSIDSATGDRLDGLGQIMNVSRAGRDDTAYRLRLRAELAINKSNGTPDELINVLQLLLGLETKDIQLDEYFPKAVYIRPRNRLVSEDTAQIAELLRRAKPAGTELHFIFSTTESDDDNTFRFSNTTGTPETSSTKGFGNGTFNGVA